MWVEAMCAARQEDRRYQVPGAQVLTRLPKPAGWQIIERWGTAQVEALETDLTFVAGVTTRAFLRRGGDRLLAAKHALSYLPYELDVRMARAVAEARRETDPQQQQRREARRESRASRPSHVGAREVLAALPTFGQGGLRAAGGAS